MATAEYHQAYHKEWYAKNREKRHAQIKARRQAVVDHIYQYKLKNPCKLCGFSHPAALDFHHRDPSTKVIEINDAIRSGWSIDRVNTEIEKCDLICANCHRILHYDERK
jgi:hypothetical protein